MSTAMDDHFGAAEAEEFEGAHDGTAGEGTAEEPVASRGGKLDAKFFAMTAVALLIAGFGGIQVYKRFAPAPSSVDNAAAAAQFSNAPAAAPVAAQAVIPAAPAAAPAAIAGTATAASAPTVAIEMPTAPVVQSGAPVQAAAASTPVAAAIAAPLAPPVAVAPAIQPAVQPAIQPAAPVAAVKQVDDARIARLTSDLEDSRAEVTRLTEKVKELELKLAQASSKAAAKPAAAKPAAHTKPIETAKTADVDQKAEIKHIAAKPAAKPAPKLEVVEAKPEVKKPAVRTDFRIYAMRDGQVWVQDNATKETVPTAVGAMLPDGSRVTKLDEDAGVISTTAGEIRYTTLAR